MRRAKPSFRRADLLAQHRRCGKEPCGAFELPLGDRDIRHSGKCFCQKAAIAMSLRQLDAVTIKRVRLLVIAERHREIAPGMENVRQPQLNPSVECCCWARRARWLPARRRQRQAQPAPDWM